MTERERIARLIGDNLCEYDRLFKDKHEVFS
jgi:hypothetical protein